MHDVAGGGAQRHHLGGGRRAVHEPQARVRRHLRLVEHAVDHALAADLLDVAERLFLDRRKSARDVALRRLRIGKIARLVPLDDLLIAVEHAHEVGAHLVVAAARRDDLLAAGELGSLAEDERATRRVQLVERVAHRGVRAAARRRVRLAALGRHPEVGQRALDALLLARPLQVFARRLRRAHDRVVVAVQLDAEALHRLARRLDAVDDALRPLLLDADDDDGGDVRIAAGADQRAEMQVEIGAELQPTVRVRDRERALDVVGDRLARGVRQVVDGQDDDVVAHADAAVLAAIAEEARFHGHHRLVLMLWTCACEPLRIGCTTLPMSTPYLMTVSPTAMSFSATLWPIGMSWRHSSSIVRSSSRMRPVSGVPALMPSTTTTATLSFGSCSTQWITGVPESWRAVAGANGRRAIIVRPAPAPLDPPSQPGVAAHTDKPDRSEPLASSQLYDV